MTDEERLRADTLDELLGKEMLDNIALRAENERLREALEEIAERSYATVERDIARAALQSKGEQNLTEGD